MKVDKWRWGNETIAWGFDLSHEFSFKILEPKLGRKGCLSLQYHERKSECWFVIQGIVWSLFVFDGQVCTRNMRAGDLQGIEKGIIHRMMGVTPDAKVVEPSTPDYHSADKTVEKDTRRLHCIFGRECDNPRSEEEARIVKKCIEVTEEAIACIEREELPPEYNLGVLKRNGATSLPF